MRANNSDQASENGAQQRQKDNRLNHSLLLFAHNRSTNALCVCRKGKPASTFPNHGRYPFIRLTSSTSIEPRLRK
jgi:hypothetical protein